MGETMVSSGRHGQGHRYPSPRSMLIAYPTFVYGEGVGYDDACQSHRFVRYLHNFAAPPKSGVSVSLNTAAEVGVYHTRRCTNIAGCLWSISRSRKDRRAPDSIRRMNTAVPIGDEVDEREATVRWDSGKLFHFLPCSKKASL